jgi:hypothetical protein
MYNHRSLPQIFVFIILITTLLACNSDVTKNITSVNAKNPEQSQVQENTLPKSISQAVLKDAAERSGLAINSLKITQSTEKTFSNSCVFNFGEVCAQIFDPIKGWEVIVKVKNKSWTYHVDTTGKRIVLEGV